MRLVVAFSTIVLAVAASCGGGKAKPTATVPAPSPAPSSLAATATVPAPTTSGPNATLVVYLHGGDLWITSLDGSTVPPRAITSGAGHGPSAGLAGYLRKPDGSIDLYYVDQLSKSMTDPRTGDSAEYGLYRLSLEGGNPEELLRFSSRPLEPFNIPTNAAVSPDGRYIAYSDDAGLALLDAASSATKRLATNGPCDAGPSSCYGYYSPVWSPDGQRLQAYEILYEESLAVIIDPFQSEPTPIDTTYGYLYNSWSPDGSKICVTRGTVGAFGDLLIYDVSSRQATDGTVNLNLPSATPVVSSRVNSHGCAWSGNGKLAIGYSTFDDLMTDRIAVVDSNFHVLSLSDAISGPAQVVAWLPDGSGVLFNRAQGKPGIYRPGVRVSDLPFQADMLLAIIL